MLEQFKKWVSEGRRSVDIRLNNIQYRNDFSIWVFDYDLEVGQFVDSVEEIDLDAKKEKEDRKTEEWERGNYEKLKAKFEGV